MLKFGEGYILVRLEFESVVTQSGFQSTEDDVQF
jgi:hypothetical protein